MPGTDLTVLVVGSGGREHAVAAKLAASDRVSRVISAPGNAGCASVGDVFDVSAEDPGGLLQLARDHNVDLVFCGPEAPLIDGLGDLFSSEEIPFFGPDSFAAQLEGSKIFAKEVMHAAGVPTAGWEAFDTFEDALEAAEKRVLQEGGVVIKADGAAAGKGVFVCSTIDEAEYALKQIMLDRVFGASGDRVLVEQRLQGQEVSLLVVASGSTYVALPPVQDHKRAFDNDKGPNTGGMGCYSPVPIMDAETAAAALKQTVEPVLEWFVKAGRPYRGCLYAGLMMTPDGIRVLEYNCRFGDPETQVIVPMLQSDLADILVGAVEDRLGEIRPKWYDGAAVVVVLASGGYPGKYQTGYPISGLQEAASLGAQVLHAGTRSSGEAVVTAGGRVLGVTALGTDFAAACKLAYEACSRISFRDMHYRKDIGARVS